MGGKLWPAHDGASVSPRSNMLHESISQLRYSTLHIRNTFGYIYTKSPKNRVPRKTFTPRVTDGQRYCLANTPKPENCSFWTYIL